MLLSNQIVYFNQLLISSESSLWSDLFVSNVIQSWEFQTRTSVCARISKGAFLGQIYTFSHTVIVYGIYHTHKTPMVMIRFRMKVLFTCLDQSVIYGSSCSLADRMTWIRVILHIDSVQPHDLMLATTFPMIYARAAVFHYFFRNVSMFVCRINCCSVEF